MQVTLDIFLLDWERPPPGKVKVRQAIFVGLWFQCFVVYLDLKMELYSSILTSKD
jgi:hypothetical protein